MGLILLHVELRILGQTANTKLTDLDACRHQFQFRAVKIYVHHHMVRCL